MFHHTVKKPFQRVLIIFKMKVLYVWIFFFFLQVNIYIEIFIFFFHLGRRTGRILDRRDTGDFCHKFFSKLTTT